MIGGQPFADLTGEHSALHGRNGGPFEGDQTCERRQLHDEFIFITKYRSSFPFEVILSKMIP